MRKYVAEMIGTFFLALTVTCTVIAGSAAVIPPLAIGAMLMVMVFAVGHFSGGHVNPAVSFGVWARGRLPFAQLPPYIAAQLAGGALAALVMPLLRPGLEANSFLPLTMPAFVAELLFTFALVFVVLNVATARGTMGNPFYGLAIGMTVMAAAFAVGGISGAALNPAVALAISMIGLLPWSLLWLYVAAELLGGLAAAGVFKLLYPEDV